MTFIALALLIGAAAVAGAVCGYRDRKKAP